jgi:hypothetical protein
MPYIRDTKTESPRDSLEWFVKPITDSQQSSKVETSSCPRQEERDSGKKQNRTSFLTLDGLLLLHKWNHSITRCYSGAVEDQRPCYTSKYAALTGIYKWRERSEVRFRPMWSSRCGGKCDAENCGDFVHDDFLLTPSSIIISLKRPY